MTGSADGRPEQTLHGLFRKVAKTQGEQIAVHWAGGELIYADLDRLSDQLAGQLRDCGVGPETLVGLCLPRSAEAVVAMLGILKAGGAYVPLDPAYPQSRLSFMVADANLRHVVTSDQLRGVFADGRVHVLTLEPPTPSTSAAAAAAAVPVALESLEYGRYDGRAYVMYTSGSTGSPKGVQIEHRSVIRLVSDVD